MSKEEELIRLKKYYDKYKDDKSDNEIIAKMAKVFKQSERTLWRKKKLWNNEVLIKEVVKKKKARIAAEKAEPVKVSLPSIAKTQKIEIPGDEKITNDDPIFQEINPSELVIVKDRDFQKAESSEKEMNLIIELLIQGARIPDIKKFFNKNQYLDEQDQLNNKKHTITNDNVLKHIVYAREWIINNTVVDLRLSASISIQRLELVFSKALKKLDFNSCLRAIVTEHSFKEQLYELAKMQGNQEGEETLSMGDIEDKIREKEEMLEQFDKDKF